MTERKKPWGTVTELHAALEEIGITLSLQHLQAKVGQGAFNPVIHRKVGGKHFINIKAVVEEGGGNLYRDDL